MQLCYTTHCRSSHTKITKIKQPHRQSLEPKFENNWGSMLHQVFMKLCSDLFVGQFSLVLFWAKYLTPPNFTCYCNIIQIRVKQQIAVIENLHSFSSSISSSSFFQCKRPSETLKYNFIILIYHFSNLNGFVASELPAWLLSKLLQFANSRPFWNVIFGHLGWIFAGKNTTRVPRVSVSSPRGTFVYKLID